MQTVYLGLGSNLDFPEKQIIVAVSRLMVLPQSRWRGVSSLYQTKPVGPQDQPDYINAVACLDTDLSPTKLLEHCQRIERLHNRVRRRRWGERTLDIDILLYGDDHIDLPDLKVPHPEMHNREFVLQPLAELQARTGSEAVLAA